MTRKDYIKAAELIRTESPNTIAKDITINIFVQFFKSDNPRFDANRFRAACLDTSDIKV